MATTPDHLHKKEFERKDWDLDLVAELYKQEFYATHSWMTGRDGMVGPWESSTAEELDRLRDLKKKERSEHIGEIVQEQQGLVLIGYWYDLLQIGPATQIGPIIRPRTTELVHATTYLGGSVATHFKARFNRPRPWVLDHDLFPPIPSPGLPAYPSGHATQMYLTFLLLKDLVPEDRTAELERKAIQVAFNRERAGLNFRSDTAAGVKLAERLFEVLTTECERFRSTFDEAKAEWNSVKRPAGPVLPMAGLLT